MNRAIEKEIKLRKELEAETMRLEKTKKQKSVITKILLIILTPVMFILMVMFNIKEE